MESHESMLSPNHQAVVDRFVSACEADDRILAAFLGGSYARGAADEHSDLDLYLVTTNKDFEKLCAERATFVRRLGQPLFLEDFEIPNMVFYILSDGAEGEIGFGRESQFNQIAHGPYRVLVDKRNILAGAVFLGRRPDSAKQTERLRRLIYWFWHDISHFITAIGRGQLWWAQGQLEILRGTCVNLARLQNNFSDTEVGEEPYFKLEKAMPVEQLADLQKTVCPPKADAMLQAALVLLQFYK